MVVTSLQISSLTKNYNFITCTKQCPIFWGVNSFRYAMTEKKKKQSQSMELQIPLTLDCKEVNVPKDFIAVISYRSKRSKQVLSWKPFKLMIMLI